MALLQHRCLSLSNLSLSLVASVALRCGHRFYVWRVQRGLPAAPLTGISSAACLIPRVPLQLCFTPLKALEGKQKQGPQRKVFLLSLLLAWTCFRVFLVRYFWFKKLHLFSQPGQVKIQAH